MKLKHLEKNMPKPPKFKSDSTVTHKILKGTKKKVDKVLHEYDKIKVKDKSARLKLTVVRVDTEEEEDLDA